jgi:AbrB family looped-hinge helix DNA binding protein
MPSAMVTFNGRITLPTDVRKQLGLKTGDNIDFIEIEKGRFAICPRPAFDAGSDSSLEITSPEMVHRSGVRELKETVQ